MKLYAISIAATAKVTGAEGEEDWEMYRHSPGIQIAASIDAAIEQGTAQAKKVWPIDEGWRGHNAAAIPITKQFCDLIDQVYDSLDLDDEESDTQMVVGEGRQAMPYSIIHTVATEDSTLVEGELKNGRQ